MIDYSKIQMSTQASSNKVLVQGPSVIHVPNLPGSGTVFGQVSIPHNFGSDKLLFQVAASLFGTDIVVPWQSGDGRLTVYSEIDANNLYVTCISEDASGFGQAPFDVTLFYRVLVP